MVVLMLFIAPSKFVSSSLLVRARGQLVVRIDFEKLDVAGFRIHGRKAAGQRADRVEVGVERVDGHAVGGAVVLFGRRRRGRQVLDGRAQIVDAQRQAQRARQRIIVFAARNCLVPRGARTCSNCSAFGARIGFVTGKRAAAGRTAGRRAVALIHRVALERGDAGRRGRKRHGRRIVEQEIEVDVRRDRAHGLRCAAQRDRGVAAERLARRFGKKFCEVAV